uniref:Uncharacterized protein n=1 Tax=Coleochaete scutata TaxID=3125 RepID=A0A5P9NVW7_COLSC|nr:hypothetical protein [Coleochaete scutata]QFU80116.1 hypothetical protein [Coleochaete scutata]
MKLTIRISYLLTIPLSYVGCFLLRFFISTSGYDCISFVLSSLPPEVTTFMSPSDKSDEITIKNVNNKIDSLLTEIKNLGVLIGGGYAIKTVMDAIPDPARKVVVGSLGLTFLFIFSSFERAYKSSTGGGGPANSLISSNSFFPYEIPSNPTAEHLDLCNWAGPLAAETILVLLFILSVELFGKSLFKRFYESQVYEKSIMRLKVLLPTWLTNYTYKTTESVSAVYLGVICFIIIWNFTYLLIVLMILRNHFKTIQISTAVTLNGWCYFLMGLLIIELFKNPITNYIFSYKGPTKSINTYYTLFLIMALMIMTGSILSTLVESMHS